MKKNDKIICFKTAEDIERERKERRAEWRNVILFAVGLFATFLYLYYLILKILDF